MWALTNVARSRWPEERLILAHRLDRDTSGVILVARSSDADRHLKNMFQRQYVVKRYVALVHGTPEWDTILIDAPIHDDEASLIRVKMGVHPDGMKARTRIFVLARFEDFSLVAALPQTGRTHQIRLHLSHVGHPILGDRIYGQPEQTFIHIFEEGYDQEIHAKVGMERHALHAQRLNIVSPNEGPIEVQAKIPARMRRIIRAGSFAAARAQEGLEGASRLAPPQ